VFLSVGSRSIVTLILPRESAFRVFLGRIRGKSGSRAGCCCRRERLVDGLGSRPFRLAEGERERVVEPVTVASRGGARRRRNPLAQAE